MIPPTVISPIQAASLIVSDTDILPRTVFPSDSLAAASQALVNDTISAGLFDDPWHPPKSTTDLSLIEQHSWSSSEDHSMSVSRPMLVQATTEEILNPDPIAHASPSCSEDHSLTALSTGSALVQTTAEEIPDAGSMGYTSSSSKSHYLSIPLPALVQKATTEEGTIEEEGEMEKYNIGYTSLSSHHLPTFEAAESTHATSMEEEGVDEELYMGHHPFDAEEHSVPQVALPEYDPNDPLWMYIDTWLNQLPNSRIPDPFVHVPAQYHHSLEIFLSSIRPPSLPSRQVQDIGLNPSSNDGPTLLGVHPNAHGPSTVLSPLTPTPMAVDDDGSFKLSAPSESWNSMWMIDEGDDPDAPYQQDWMRCNQYIAERVLAQFEVDYDERYADDVQHFDDFHCEEE